MLVPNKNSPGYKEHVIFFAFSFVDGVTVIYWMENMELYVLTILE